jgi:ribosomal-protein-alanine N-acetyltransferase
MRWWDIPAVMHVEHELFGDESWSDTMFWSELAQRETRYYVVVEDGSSRAAAYAGLCVYGRREAYVQTIAVSRPLQGKGIGTELLRCLIVEAERRGAEQLDLEVRADNPGAQGLYAAHGFAEIGVRRAYYQPSGVDAIVMRRIAA